MTWRVTRCPSSLSTARPRMVSTPLPELRHHKRLMCDPGSSVHPTMSIEGLSEACSVPDLMPSAVSLVSQLVNVTQDTSRDFTAIALLLPATSPMQCDVVLTALPFLGRKRSRVFSSMIQERQGSEPKQISKVVQSGSSKYLLIVMFCTFFSTYVSIFIVGGMSGPSSTPPSPTQPPEEPLNSPGPPLQR